MRFNPVADLGFGPQLDVRNCSANHTCWTWLVRGGAMRPLRHTNFDSCGNDDR